MRITDIHIDGFGVWTGLELPDLSGKLTVIYGPNEAGKTTLMQFVRAALFGFNDERRERYLPPVHGGRPGGTLTVGNKSTQYRIGRFLTENRVGELREDLTITDSAGRRQTDGTLDMLLSGIDEATLNNVFAVGLREIQELATLNDTEAAQHLYALAGGLDRVALVEVRKELHESRNRLLTPGNRDSQIHHLLERRRQIKSRIDELSEMTRRWGRQSTDNDDITARIEETKEELDQLKQEAQFHEVAMILREPWRRRAMIDQRLAHLATLPQTSFATLDELNDLKEQEEKYTLREQELKKKWEDRREKLGQGSVNSELLEHRSRIQSLVEQETWLHRIQPQTVRLEKEIEEFESKLQMQYSALGLIGDGLDCSPGFSSLGAVLATLTESARELREAKRRLASTKRRATENREQQQVAVASVEQALTSRGETDLTTAVENAAYQVELLRRRVQVDERLQQAERHRAQLDEESNDWLERHVLTDQQIWLIGTLFVAGAVMLLCALFGWMTALDMAGESRWLLAILGMGCVVATAISKASFERIAKEHFDDCHKQLALLEKQHSQARDERDQLDEVLPRGHGPYSVQLKSAEADLDGLQQLVPLDTKRRAGRGQSDNGQKNISSAGERYKRARSRWRDALVAASLSENLNPDDLDRMSQDAQEADELRRHLQAKKRELEGRRTEITALKDQIDRVLLDCNLEGELDEPLTLLQQLRKELKQQEQRARRRKSLRREIQRLHRNHQKCGQAVVKMRRRRRSLLAEAGVADEQQLHRLVEEAGQTQQLRQERDQISQQITTAIGLQYDEQQVNALLQGTGETDVERRLEKVWDRQQACEASLNRMYEQSGQQMAQPEQARDDRRLAIAQLELGCVEQQLRSSARRWHTIGITSRILDSVCEGYESERQPETLRDASQLFEHMTEGRYRRIWTPLERDILRVEDRSGRTLGIESLSTGTREQLFLSLRLAVAQMFGRGGRRLPLLLDDVLVNFDADRTKTAGRVLREFCKSGHQLILFTCHEHIVKVFRSLRANVIDLPSHAELVGVEEEEKPRRKKRRRKNAAQPVVESTAVDDPAVTQASQVEEEVEEEVAEEIAEFVAEQVEQVVIGEASVAETLPEPIVEPQPVAPPAPEFIDIPVAQTVAADEHPIWDNYITWHSESLEGIDTPDTHTPWESTTYWSDTNGRHQVEHNVNETHDTDLLVVHQAHGLPAWHTTEPRPEVDSERSRSDGERRLVL